MFGQVLEHWPLDRLKEYENNPRKNNHAVDRMVAAIREFGFNVPVVARHTGELVDGHLRLKAARKMGLAQVPVIVLPANVDEAHVRAFRLSVNQLATLGKNDDAKLRQELEFLLNANFSMDAMGFDVGQLDKYLYVFQGDASGEGTPEEKTAHYSLDDLAPTEEELKLLHGKKFLVEFSGGKDSSTAALWCKTFFPDQPLELVFVDMGADFTGYPIFLREFSEALGAELRVVRSQTNIIDLLMLKGRWPGFRHPYCHVPLHDALDGVVSQHAPDSVVIVRGGRLEEKSQASEVKKDRFLKVARLPEHVYFHPLYFAKKELGEGLLRQEGLPIWEGYIYGLQRTACRVCPGQKPRAYAAIRAQYPGVWEELLALERRLGLGYWQDPTAGKTMRVEALADKGEAAFRDGQYRTRFSVL